jgi:membrane-associated protease RseP (regulator of RpoE activity)
MASRDAGPSPALSLLGLFGLVALLVWWAGWALPVVILAVIVMIMGHEFGHFITAKRAGLLVTDFFVGFGPVLWSTTRGETRYGVRAFPLGGYVKVPGMTWDADVAPEIEKRTYRSASYPRKVFFASAGSLMHGLMALVLAWASLTFVGLPSSSHVGVLAFSHWDGYHQTAAQRAGLHVGDQITNVDGVTVTSADQLVALVHRHAGTRLTLRVMRDGNALTLRATPVDGRTLKEGGVALASGAKPDGFLGIAVGALVTRSSLLGAVPGAFHQVGVTFDAALRGIGHVFTPGEFASLFHQVASPAAAANRANQLARPESIVGVVRLAVQSTQSGVGSLLEILMAVNIFVGVLNMVPMLPLDGGYVLVATYERLRSRKGRAYHANVNRLTPVIYAFMSVLLVLFASTLYLDIVHPIANPF